MTEPLQSRRPAAPVWAGLSLDRPRVMGVLNVTPDSFSDGGRIDPEAAIAAGLAMRDDGADIVDVGGESTRPGAAPTSPEVERARILPVIRALAAAGVLHFGRYAPRRDHGGGARRRRGDRQRHHRPDPRPGIAAALVAARGCPVILMHMRGTPGDHDGSGAVRRRRRRGDRRTEPTWIEAAERAGIARDGDRHRPRLWFRQASAAFARSAARPVRPDRTGIADRRRRVAQRLHRRRQRRAGPGAPLPRLHRRRSVRAEPGGVDPAGA